MNSARDKIGSSGTQTAALAYGGTTGPPVSALTESWNGSNWTAVADLSTARKNFGSFGTTNTIAIAAGGETPPTRSNLTEVYNGTNWITGANMNVSKAYQAGAGGSTAGVVAFGAVPGGLTNTSEEWNSPASVTQTITTS